MSKFHFCRHFKDATGLTFRESLVRQRVARASGLLLDRDRSVSQVYLEVGLKDLGHFSRVFRRLTGQPPPGSAASPGTGPGVGKARVTRADFAPVLPPRPLRHPSATPAGKKSNRRQIESNRRQAGWTRWG